MLEEIKEKINTSQQPFLIITGSTKEAEIVAASIGGMVFPSPQEDNKEITAQRIRVLNEMPRIVVAPAKAIAAKTLSHLQISTYNLQLSLNKEYQIEKLTDKLIELGYKRQEIVGERGEFAVRGGIVDIFHYEPVRIEFFGDKIESIRVFDAQTQRSVRKLEKFTILPIIEKGETSFLEHLAKDTVILKVEIKETEEGIPPIKKKTVKEGINRELLLELKDGDLVVHENYGIGIYRGLQKMEMDGAEQEYLLLEYARNDRLYVPLQQMGLIEKYSGDPNPKIYRLHGKEWKKTKSKVEKSLQDLTDDLLHLYAVRSRTFGYAFPKDEQTQNELAATFPYEETPDQQKAIRDVMADMESDHPMDRLMCADVGYGKTEVAIRAAFKAAVSGKQAAVLAPTTILAQQHFVTFSERLKNYPVKIEVVSRFKSREEQKEILAKTARHEVDILIGTHRLLQKDVAFADLGLLIVDEEQRFGVGHKEKLKKLRANVDVITLTATPIPRTLYFSLSGARDMSLINTAPVDRLPIKTRVLAWDEELIKEAILRELDRGGQVYFVHNRVQTINSVAAKIKKLVPEAKIAVGHGQMRENELAKIMAGFQEKKFDLLLCTTIIESGLDIPNVNTLIVDHAERFGLAELYQLRGRVGRSSSRAYAYLFYHKEKVLTQDALERLSAIQEFTELGSGYRLALRDLEIRGSGTLLGARQHGHIVSVGFDMYCDLLEEAVKKAKGIEEPLPRQVIVDLKISAYIPPSYISDERQRVATYRRLTLLSDKKQLDEMKTELSDRYGAIPNPLNSLLEIVDLRINAQKAGVKLIKEEKERILVDWLDGRHKYLTMKDIRLLF